MIGAVFWNYLSVVFSFIAETVAWERWEGTLEYTFMAPGPALRPAARLDPLRGRYGLIHTAVVLAVLIVFFGLDLSHANFVTAAVFMLLGSLSFIGIGMMAAILPLLYVERGDQMVFVLQSLLLLFSGVYYSVDDPARLDAVRCPSFCPATYILDGVRAGLIDGVAVRALWRRLAAAGHGRRLHPAGLWVFGRAERYAKRTGKLKRVG